MKRMNLRDVPDDVYAHLAEAAEARRQSLSAFVVDQLTDVVKMMDAADYLDGYLPPPESTISAEQATDAVVAVRQAS